MSAPAFPIHRGASDAPGDSEDRAPASTTVLVRRIVAATVLAAVLAVAGGRVGAALFAVVAFGAGVRLFRRDQSAYLAYAWWLWMLTPGLRRVVDYLHGFDATSPILVAPLVVSSITLASAVRHLPKLQRPALLPFAAVGLGVLYGYMVGIAEAGLVPASYGLLTWIVPPAFGLHLAMRWQDYPEHRRRLQQLLLHGTLVLGIYGVLQFVAPLPWDRQWIVDSGMITIGRPVAYQLRVFSFLNSPGPFATVMAASIVALLATGGRLRLFAISAGVMALLLTLGRAAWIACVTGVLVYLAYLRIGARVRAVIAIVALTAVIVPLLAATDIVDVIAPRMQTLTAIQTDPSYEARSDFVGQMMDAVGSNPFGYGIGATGSANVLSNGNGIRSFDNGVIDVWYSLGWFGATMFWVGLLGIALAGLPPIRAGDDSFAIGARAAFVCLVLQMAAVNVLTGVMGVVAWTFAGMMIAAREWHRHQRNADLLTWRDAPRSPHAAFRPGTSVAVLPNAS